MKANRVVWRDVEYDSQLEADWSATLTKWRVDFRYHPGRVFLGTTEWQPDFQVDAGGRDLLLEVKGPGNDRIEKVYDARKRGHNVIVGRPGWMPPDPLLDHAGAVWEDASEWCLVTSSGWTRFHSLREDAAAGHWRWSADYAWEHEIMGMPMFKAVGAHAIV